MSIDGASGAAFAKRALVDAAADIGGQIRDRAVRLIDGSLIWSGSPAPGPETGPGAAVLGSDLYGGATGVALFMAALARVTRSDAYRQASLDGLAPVLHLCRRSLARDPASANLRAPAVGGLTGLGSMVYSFVRIGQWLDESALIDEAHQLSTLFSRSCIEADTELDIVGGSAGAILALLALSDVAPEPNDHGATPLQLAQACALHLLARRWSPGEGPRAWPAAPYPPLSGFAHGAAGICYALLRLYEQVQNPDLLEAAREGLAFERAQFDAECQNWRDLRYSDARCQISWCHGAPGIALGRLGALDVLCDDEILQEIETALDTTRALPCTPLDHLCCGNMGRVEVFLVAHQKLGEPRWLEEARSLAGRVLRRAQERGHFSFTPDVATFDETLFRGAAGVGLSLLRLAEPDMLTSPLTME